MRDACVRFGEADGAEDPSVACGDRYPALTALWRKAAVGDSAAYRLFLLRVAPLLRRMVGRRIPEGDTEDVVQEILISVHKARHMHDGLRPVVPWLAAVARRRTADYLRVFYAQARHEMQDALDFADMPSDSSWGNVSESMSMEEALSDASERERVILIMMHAEGFTAKETGVRLGMNESAVKTAACRAMKKIRRRFGR